MKKTVYCLITIISMALFAACGESIEEKAQRSLQSARAAYEAGNFQNAKIEHRLELI